MTVPLLSMAPPGGTAAPPSASPKAGTSTAAFGDLIAGLAGGLAAATVAGLMDGRPGAPPAGHAGEAPAEAEVPVGPGTAPEVVIAGAAIAGGAMAAIVAAAVAGPSVAAGPGAPADAAADPGVDRSVVPIPVEGRPGPDTVDGGAHDSWRAGVPPGGGVQRSVTDAASRAPAAAPSGRAPSVAAADPGASQAWPAPGAAPGTDPAVAARRGVEPDVAVGPPVVWRAGPRGAADTPEGAAERAAGRAVAAAAIVASGRPTGAPGAPPGFDGRAIAPDAATTPGPARERPGGLPPPVLPVAPPTAAERSTPRGTAGARPAIEAAISGLVAARWSIPQEGEGADESAAAGSRPATERLGPPTPDAPQRPPLLLDGKVLVAELLRSTVPVSAYRGAEVPAGSLPTGTMAAEGEVPQQVIRAIRLQWSQGVGEARLRLHPEHLGEVTIALKVEGGRVTAALRTETAAAQQWIEAYQQDLRAALKAQGLDLAAFVVTRDRDGRPGQGDGRPSQDEADEPRGQRAPKPGTDEPRFDVVV